MQDHLPVHAGDHLAGPAEARQDLLTEQEFDLLRVVYEKPLRDMGKALLDQLMSSGLSKDSKTGIQLRPAQLQALNALMRAGEPVQVPFDLVSLRQLFQGQRPEDGFFQRDIMTKRPEQLSIAQLVQLTNEVGEQLQKIEKSAGGGEKTGSYHLGSDDAADLWH